MSAYHGPVEQFPPWQSLGELHATLARYRPDDDSWPRGLLHLQNAIKLKVAAETRAVTAMAA
jgi:hypothetical protein